MVLIGVTTLIVGVSVGWAVLYYVRREIRRLEPRLNDFEERLQTLQERVEGRETGNGGVE